MITKRDIKMIHNALNMAEMSDYHKYHIGCVIAQKGKVLSASFNSSKTHPVQKMYNKYRYNGDSTPHSVHAEIHALSQIADADVNWKQVTVYVARKRNQDGKYGMSRDYIHNFYSFIIYIITVPKQYYLHNFYPYSTYCISCYINTICSIYIGIK